MLQEAAATSPSAGINLANPSNPRTPPSSPQSKKPRSQASPKPTPKPQWRYTILPEEDQTSHWADFLISHPFDQTMKFKFFLSIYILFFCNRFRHLSFVLHYSEGTRGSRIKSYALSVHWVIVFIACWTNFALPKLAVFQLAASILFLVSFLALAALVSWHFQASLNLTSPSKQLKMRLAISTMPPLIPNTSSNHLRALALISEIKSTLARSTAIIIVRNTVINLTMTIFWIEWWMTSSTVVLLAFLHTTQNLVPQAHVIDQTVPIFALEAHLQSDILGCVLFAILDSWSTWSIFQDEVYKFKRIIPAAQLTHYPSVSISKHPRMSFSSHEPSLNTSPVLQALHFPSASFRVQHGYMVLGSNSHSPLSSFLNPTFTQIFTILAFFARWGRGIPVAALDISGLDTDIVGVGNFPLRALQSRSWDNKRQKC